MLAIIVGVMLAFILNWYFFVNFITHRLCIKAELMQCCYREF